MVKPDGVERGLVGEVIQRFERKGYTLSAIKMVRVTEEFAKQHYADLSSKPFFGGLCNFICSGPVVAMVWVGFNVVAGGRALIGATNPADSLPGTFRGDYAVDIGRNIIHGSDSVESAEKEIALWFKDEEVLSWTPTRNQHIYEKP